MNRVKRIVFTGGPSGGKTSIIELVQRRFGKKVATVPEAATILYQGGFPRKSGPEAMRHIQRAIYYTVRELEDMVADLSGDRALSRGSADTTKVVGRPTASVSLCDRGTLDGMAYWPEGGDDFLSSVESTLKKEFDRYAMVIHLKSPLSQSGYQTSSTRIESHRQALELDKKTEQVWKGHPNRFVVSDEPDFLIKVNRVMEMLDTEIPRLVG